MVEGNHCVADHANTSYGFIVLLQPAVNGLIRKAVNESSTKYVYVMSAYSKGPIRSPAVVAIFRCLGLDLDILK